MHTNLQQQTGQQLLGKGRGKVALQEDRELWVVIEIFDALTSRVGVCVYVCFQTHPIVHFKYVKFIVYTIFL